MQPAPFRPVSPSPSTPDSAVPPLPASPSPRVTPSPLPSISPSPSLRVSPSPRVSIHVGRLVLDGFTLPPGGERQVQAAFEGELGRLMAAGDLPALLRSGGARRDLPGELSISTWTGPADLGRQIARAVFAGLGK